MILIGNHINYHIEGYKSAAWALPIEKEKVIVRKLDCFNYNANITRLLERLSKVINLKTKIMYVCPLNL